MTRPYVEAPATHFRLKPETWAIIAEEYKNGATAKDIGANWKVAPSSVYRYACRDGFTKKRMGDARARAHARMVEEEEASARSMHPVGSRALKALFQPAPAKVTIETMDLQLLFDILFVEKDRVKERFAIWGEGEQAENYELKSRFWPQWHLPNALVRKAQETGQHRARQLERQIRALGAEPEPEPDWANYRPDRG